MMKLNFVPPSHDHGWYYTDENGHVVMAQGQPVPISVASELAGCVNAGWQPWGGGIIPADAVGRVDVQLRGGDVWQDEPADDVYWQHDRDDDSSDVVFWRITTCPWSLPTDMADTNGWHDIEAHPGHKVLNSAPVADMVGAAPDWPDESRADRDPTAIQGGVVAHDAGGCAPPVLVDRPVNVGTRLCNGILLGIGAISAALALACIGAGFPPAAVLFTANGMYAVHNATT